MLLMSLWFIGAQAQETVRGVVTDAAGEPLIGANVVEKECLQTIRPALLGAAKPRPAPVPPADINSDRRYGWYSAHRTNVPLRTVPSPASHNSVGSIEQPPLGICSYHGPVPYAAIFRGT